jgi:hypothetical protein
MVTEAMRDFNATLKVATLKVEVKTSAQNFDSMVNGKLEENKDKI